MLLTILVEAVAGMALAKVGAAFAASLAVFAAAWGIGRIGATALESMARQPEMASTLRTNMILGCAITETTGIYSLVVALLLMFMKF